MKFRCKNNTKLINKNNTATGIKIDADLLAEIPNSKLNNLFIFLFLHLVLFLFLNLVLFLFLSLVLFLFINLTSKFHNAFS